MPATATVTPAPPYRTSSVGFTPAVQEIAPPQMALSEPIAERRRLESRAVTVATTAPPPTRRRPLRIERPKQRVTAMTLPMPMPTTADVAWLSADPTRTDRLLATSGLMMLATSVVAAAMLTVLL